MTSVPQLPIEATSAKALPQGETPRARANKPTEEGGEGGFAAALALALPELQPPAKAERAVEAKSLRVEGEGVPAEEGKPLADAAKGEAATLHTPAQAVRLAAPSTVLEVAPAVGAAPMPAQPAATAPEQGRELAAVKATPEERTATAPTAESAAEKSVAKAEVGVEQAVADDYVEEEQAEFDDTPRREPTNSLEKTSVGRQVAPSETTAAETTQPESQTRERPHTAQPALQPVEPSAAAPVHVEQGPPPKKATARAEQSTSGSSAQPQQKEGPPAAAAALRHIVESPVAAKTEPSSADETPVIEFQVRKESPSQDVRPQREVADWVRTLSSKGAETQRRAVPQGEAAAVQPNVVPRHATVAVPAEAVTEAEPAEKVVAVAAVAQQELESIRAKDFRQSPSHSAEDVDPRRPLSQPVAAASQGELQQNDEQAGRGDAAYAGEELVERKAPQAPEAVSVKNIVAKSPVDPQADKETIKQVTVKPYAADLVRLGGDPLSIAKRCELPTVELQMLLQLHQLRPAKDLN